MKQRKGLFKVKVDGLDSIYQLYNTIIYKNDGQKITLNTDGFRTNHTKNCINDLLPNGYRVFQKDFEWFLSTEVETIPFNDNMEIRL